MSDLAPFVAAALRDKTIADLQEEIDRLRKEKEHLNAVIESNHYDVFITGPNQICTHVSGTFDFANEKLHLHYFRPIRVDKILDYELYIRGYGKIISFRDFAESNDWTVEYSLLLKHFVGNSSSRRQIMIVFFVPWVSKCAMPVLSSSKPCGTSFALQLGRTWKIFKTKIGAHLSILAHDAAKFTSGLIASCCLTKRKKLFVKRGLLKSNRGYQN